MSAADELRQAAEKEREEWGGEQNARQYPTSAAIHLAVADLLDRIAEDREMDPYMAKHFDEASLVLARLINGGAR